MKTRDLAYIALFAAITAVLGLLPAVPVPAVPVPITAQTLGVMLAGAVLGARRGFLALLLFLALVAIGLPLLAGGRRLLPGGCRDTKKQRYAILDRFCSKDKKQMRDNFSKYKQIGMPYYRVCQKVQNM